MEAQDIESGEKDGVRKQRDETNSGGDDIFDK